jgi:hypothetical protein
LAQYYYLVASLPMLFFDSERPPSLEEFLTLCAEHLSPADLRMVEAAGVSAEGPSGPTCALLERWRAWETALRNELVRLRAKAHGLDPERHLREGEEIVSVTNIARSAFAQDLPLAAEQSLDRARWDFLDELEEGHYFDVEKVVAYHLRLQILSRRRLFDVETGTEAFGALYEKITRPIFEAAAL